MTRVAVSEAQIISTLKAVVAEHPDHVYNAPEYMRSEDQGNECFYVHVDENGDNPVPGCLVGAVLHRCGVPLEELAKHEGLAASMVLPWVLESASFGMGHVMDAVQGAQDEGKTWGKALAAMTDRAMI